MQVDSSIKSDVYRLAVGYSFIRRDNLEVGAAIGLHATDFEATLSGDGQVGNTPIQTQRRKRDLVAPMLSLANAFSEDKARCYEAGMNDFVSKPVVPDDLYAVLLSWLEKSAASAGAGRRIG